MAAFQGNSAKPALECQTVPDYAAARDDGWWRW